MTIGIRVMGSGSTGNCYRLEKNGRSLLIECGFAAAKIMEWLDHDLTAIDGCLVSHEHQDHAKAAGHLNRMGIGIYASSGTLDAIGMTSGNVLRPDDMIRVGSWDIKPLSMDHDAREPIGFMICNGTDQLLFATDTASIPYRVGCGINYLMIECNYSLDALVESMQSGGIDMGQYKRIVWSHFGLENVLEWISENCPLSRMREIHLIHLSDRHINPAHAKSAVMKKTGIPVFTWR